MQEPLAALEQWLRTPGQEERDACLVAWLPLVKRIWARLKVSLPPSADAIADDLLQCGSMGLLNAMETFEPSKAVPFEAWARLKIRGAMLDELRRQDYLSKECRRRWKALQRATMDLEQALQRACSEEELARHLGISLEQLREDLLKNSPATMVFLDGLTQDHSQSGWDHLADPEAPMADVQAIGGELKEALASAIGALPQQERTLLALLLDQGLGHKEASLVLGLSPGRISQIYAKAILHLQAALAVKFTV